MPVSGINTHMPLKESGFEEHQISGSERATVDAPADARLMFSTARQFDPEQRAISELHEARAIDSGTVYAP